MRKITILLIAVLALSFSVNAQKNQRKQAVPAEVKQILQQYVTILTSSDKPFDHAIKFINISGGDLLKKDKYSLKSQANDFLAIDFEHINEYLNPVKIVKVSVSDKPSVNGIQGTEYKITIGRKDGKITNVGHILIVVPKDKRGNTTAPKIVFNGTF